MVAKRSQGRPKKSPVKKRRPGRPRKSPVKKRSPGRPKKSPVKKRSPGRPKKKTSSKSSVKGQGASRPSSDRSIDREEAIRLANRIYRRQMGDVRFTDPRTFRNRAEFNIALGKYLQDPYDTIKDYGPIQEWQHRLGFTNQGIEGLNPRARQEYMHYVDKYGNL
jgi:hypothetical protein